MVGQVPVYPDYPYPSSASTTTTQIGTTELLVFGATAVVVWLFFSICLGRVFKRAGEPGWHAFVPLLNSWTLVKAAGLSGLWFVLLLVPIVNVVASIFVLAALATRFGRGAGFAVGLIVLTPIFLPILAFGKDKRTWLTEPAQPRFGGGGVVTSGWQVAPVGPSPWGAQPAAGAGTAGGPPATPPRPPGSPRPGPALPPLTPAASAPATVAPAIAAPAVAAAPATAAPATAAPDPGWYTDPAAPDRIRWWDGTGWTEHTGARVEG